MIVLGIDPSLTATGLVIIDTGDGGEMSIIASKVIETHPSQKGLKGIEYEMDVYRRCISIATDVDYFLSDYTGDVDKVVIESVPFARGWKSAVASNAIKGTLAATIALAWNVDAYNIHLVDPKVVKKHLKSLPSYVHLYSNLFGDTEHEQKDFVVAYVRKNYPAMVDTTPTFYQYTRLEREAVADAIVTALAFIEAWGK